MGLREVEREMEGVEGVGAGWKGEIGKNKGLENKGGEEGKGRR